MKIELTETEIVHIMDSLRMRITDLRETNAIHLDMETADLAHELEELEHDLFEASARSGEWNDPEDPDLPALKFVPAGTMRRGSDAETQMFNAGVDAREKMKATSRAAERRNFNLKGPDPKLSKTQTHDVWDANDPKNW